MAAAFDPAVAHFIATCQHVTAVHDLTTKWRLELTGGYILDLYFNETLGKYSYTLVQGNNRILGWDNAPHHSGLANFPIMYIAPLDKSNHQDSLVFQILI